MVKQCPLVVKMCVLAYGSFLLKLINNIAGCSDKQRHSLLQMKVCKSLQIPLTTFYNVHIIYLCCVYLPPWMRIH